MFFLHLALVMFSNVYYMKLLQKANLPDFKLVRGLSYLPSWEGGRKMNTYLISEELLSGWSADDLSFAE